MVKNINVNNNPQTPKVIKSSSFLLTKKGAIIPAESQATAALVKNSANDFFWPTDNFSTGFYDTIPKEGVKKKLTTGN